MSPLGKDKTSHASPVVRILPFTLHIMGSIPHGDIHSLLNSLKQSHDKMQGSTSSQWSQLAMLALLRPNGVPHHITSFLAVNRFF
jgi:hypothetical protein